MSLTTSISSTLATTVASSASSYAMVTPSLATTFTPTATTCTENHLTMLANREFEIWNNMPVPVPGSTFVNCYPSQFASSWLLSAGAVTQAAFDPLICPQNYSPVGPYTSNYIACCPSGYSFAQPTTTVFTDRPAWGGTCYTPLTESTSYVVTAYGSVGVTATTVFIATVTNAQAYAYPMDGYAFGVAEVPSITSAAATTTKGSSAAATHTVLADTDPLFTPSSVTASVGDSILFLFESGNHSVTQSTFDNPCERLSGGFDSGYEANINNADATTPNYTISVTSSNSEWFFSKQGTECKSGMVFALNPSSTQPYTTFHQNALNTNSNSGGTSTSVKVGASIGSIAGAFLIFALLFILYRRHRKSTTTISNPEDGTDNKPAMIGTSQGTWPVENKPSVPPKGAELHDQSKPGELSDTNLNNPAELEHDEQRFVGTERDPAEMWSPARTMVSQNPHSGFERIGKTIGNPDERERYNISPDER